MGVGTGRKMRVRTGGGLGVGTGGEMGVGIGGRGGSRMGTGEKSDQFVICDATQRGPDLPLNQVQAPLTDQVQRSSPAVAPSTPHPKPAAEQRSEERKLLSASFNSSASRSTRRGDARIVRRLAVRGTPREEDGGGEVKGVGESRSEDKENSVTRCIVERQEKQLQELQEKVRSYPWSIPATLDGLFPLFPPLPPLTFYPSLSSLSPSLPLPSLPSLPPPLLPLSSLSSPPPPLLFMQVERLLIQQATPPHPSSTSSRVDASTSVGVSLIETPRLPLATILPTNTVPDTPSSTNPSNSHLRSVTVEPPLNTHGSTMWSISTQVGKVK